MPNAGKSSLFNALTRAGAQAANYPFTTVEPNVAVVGVPGRAPRSGGRDGGRAAGRARDDPVPRHRRARARRAPGRGARQQVPREHPRDRRDPARGPRPRRPAGGAPGGARGPARRRRDDRDRAAVRRPGAGRAAARAGVEAGEVAGQGGGCGGARGCGQVVEALRAGRAVRTVPEPDDAPGALTRLSALTSKPVLYVANVAEGEPLEPPAALVEHAEALRRPRDGGERAAGRRALRAGRRRGRRP